MICSQLWPTLRRDLRPSFEELSEEVELVLAETLSLTKREERYLETFYEKRRFDPATLFDGLEADPNLAQHPMAAWRLRRRPEGED